MSITLVLAYISQPEMGFVSGSYKAGFAGYRPGGNALLSLA
ncbi:hypothetical protein [Pseudomonas sp.]|nr:hypothetical protein [Pseudomonas sp.]